MAESAGRRSSPAAAVPPEHPVPPASGGGSDGLDGFHEAVRAWVKA
jgi:hypothetical protein